MKSGKHLGKIPPLVLNFMHTEILEKRGEKEKSVKKIEKVY